jgi:peptide/nickel transport system substrate-binding protein
MPVRVVLSTAAMIAGAALLGAAVFAETSNANSDARGGTLRVDERSDFDFVDPALSYFSHSWRLQYTTCAKLLNYPDREGTSGARLIPEIAARMPTVSRDGRTYTFTLRTTYRFNTGKRVTAADVVATFARSRRSQFAVAFMRDVVSFRALGTTRVRFRLRAPRGDFLARVAMPFFCILPAGTPFTPEGLAGPIPSAGPYYLESWEKNRTAVLARNPFYRGPRPRNPDRIVYNIGIAFEAQQARCERGDSDHCLFPPASATELASRYGVNRGRFFVKPQMVTWFLAFNERRPLFSNNDRLEQAINYALDRRAMVAWHGPFAGTATDQLLPYNFPGFRNWNIYPLNGPNLARARALAQGATRGGTAVLWTFNSAFGPGIAEIVKRNLAAIGLQVDIVTMDRVTQTTRALDPNAEYDILLNGHGQNHADPTTFYGSVLSTQGPNNNNLSKFTEARWQRRIAAATRMPPGPARLRAWSNLERDILRGAAPIAPYVNTNARFLVSSRTRCVVFQPLYGMSLNAACVV